MSSLADLIAEARLLVPGKLLDDEPLEEHNWNTMVDLCEKYNDVLSKIDNNIPPVNYIYIQFPGMPSPDVLWDQPSARWKNISGFFPGDFFRVEGGNASAFKEDIDFPSNVTPPADLVHNTGDGGSGGGQMDSIRNITGAFGMIVGAVAFDAFFLSSIGTWFSGNNGAFSGGVSFDASRSPGVLTASENRPRNSTVRIWQRKS